MCFFIQPGSESSLPIQLATVGVRHTKAVMVSRVYAIARVNQERSIRRPSRFRLWFGRRLTGRRGLAGDMRAQDLDADLLLKLQRHGVVGEARDLADQAAGGDHFVALLELLQPVLG